MEWHAVAACSAPDIFPDGRRSLILRLAAGREGIRVCVSDRFLLTRTPSSHRCPAALNRTGFDVGGARYTVAYQQYPFPATPPSSHPTRPRVWLDRANRTHNRLVQQSRLLKPISVVSLPSLCPSQPRAETTCCLQNEMLLQKRRLSGPDQWRTGGEAIRSARCRNSNKRATDTLVYHRALTGGRGRKTSRAPGKQLPILLV